MSYRCIVVMAALLGAGSVPLQAQRATPQAQKSDSEYIAIGRQYAEWFLAGQGDSLVAHMNTEDRAEAKASDYVERRDRLMARAGDEVQVLEEKLNRRKGFRQYWRESSYVNIDEPVVIRFLLNDAGEITGMGMGPKSQTPPPDPE